MALASGLAGQFGLAAETTWSTYAAPTRFLEITAESLKLDLTHIESAGLRANNLVLRQDRQIVNKSGISGDVSMEVASSGFGLWFKHMLGAIDGGVAAGSTGKTFTATLGDTIGLGLTLQVGRPDITGTVQPFSYTGCKVMSWSIDQAVDGILMLRTTLDGYDELTSQGLVAASYAATATNELFQYGEGVCTVGGTSYDITSFGLTGTNPLRNDRRFIRGDTRQKEQLRNGIVGITGSLTAEFSGLTQYAKFPAGTVGAVTMTWTGSSYEASQNFKLAITMPAVRFDGDTPNLSGTDIVTHTQPFTVLNPSAGGQPISIAYTTQDAQA